MRKRNKEILLVLSDKELAELNKKMKEKGLKRSDLLIQLARELTPIKALKPNLTLIKPLLYCDADAINQLARNINANRTLNIEEYLNVVNILHIHVLQLEEEIMEARKERNAHNR